MLRITDSLTYHVHDIPSVTRVGYVHETGSYKRFILKYLAKIHVKTQYDVQEIYQKFTRINDAR